MIARVSSPVHERGRLGFSGEGIHGRSPHTVGTIPYTARRWTTGGRPRHGYRQQAQGWEWKTAQGVPSDRGSVPESACFRRDEMDPERSGLFFAPSREETEAARTDRSRAALLSWYGNLHKLHAFWREHGHTRVPQKWADDKVRASEGR